MPIDIYHDTSTSRITYDRAIFPGGEVHVRLRNFFPPDPSRRNVRIHANLRCSNDIMEMIMLTDALRRAGWHITQAFIPYLPYARQDRVCSPGEALSLRVMCDLINAQNYDSVVVCDAHSDGAVALLNRAHNFAPDMTIYGVHETTVLVAPDAGAIKKVAAVAAKFKVPFVRADKTRDPKTGLITGTVVYSDHIGDRNFLIIDDICDGGRTFIELAEKLRPLTHGQINLYVTHGIFSKGRAIFNGVIDNIWCPYPFDDASPKQIRNPSGQTL